MMFSAWLVPLQPGSWLMSIFAGLGAVPSNLTVPFTVATVAGSMGVAAGAEVSGALLDCSVFSFLLHAASANNAHNASMLTNRVTRSAFLFMMSPFLKFIKSSAGIVPTLARAFPTVRLIAYRMQGQFTNWPF